MLLGLDRLRVPGRDGLRANLFETTGDLFILREREGPWRAEARGLCWSSSCMRGSVVWAVGTTGYAHRECGCATSDVVSTKD